MQRRNGISRNRPALTIMEMVIALAIVTAIFAAVLPQLRLINNSWDSKQGAAEVLQNGRVFTDHISRNLAEAARITGVSDSSETNGYIEFEDNDGNNLRYDISDNNYVEFGPVGSLSDLAGPVSSLRFTCYDNNDLDNPITDVNYIRFVTVQSDFPNPARLGSDKTFTTSVYLRTGKGSDCDDGLAAWWKLDETSGTTAADSSGNGNNGTLVNMNPATCWIGGQVSGALDLDGYNDYVTCGNGQTLNITDDITVAFWLYLDTFSNEPDVITKGNYTQSYSIWVNTSGQVRFALNNDRLTSNSTLSTGTWYHIAVTRSGSDRKIYIDGQEDASDTYGTAIGTTTGALTLSSSSYEMNGRLDDVRIYNRALEPEEVAQLANILTYDGFNEAKAGSDTASVTISTPDTNEGDLLIAAVATDGDTSSSLAAPPSEGWTLIDRTASGGAVTLGAWWKLADASESATHQFTWTGNEQAYGWMMRFTGHNPADPIDDYSSYGESSSTPTSPAVTTTAENCLILRLGAFDGDDITIDDTGLSSDHTDITMDESSSSSGTVSIAGSWTSGLTHTAPSASNRVLIFTAHVEENASINLNSVTYGGQTMTKITDEIVGSSYTAYVVAYRLNEAGIAAATGNTFSPSWSRTPDDVSYTSVFLENVNQASPIRATAGNGTASSSPNPITTSALATSAGDMVIVAATCGNTGNYSLYNGFTKALELDMASSTGVVGYKSATGASETPSARHSSPNRQVIIGLVVQGASASGTVSGGAGYVKQSAAGDSGTSTFALISADDAQMLTIAIAPDDSAGCTGEIRP